MKMQIEPNVKVKEKTFYFPTSFEKLEDIIRYGLNVGAGEDGIKLFASSTDANDQIEGMFNNFHQRITHGLSKFDMFVMKTKYLYHSRLDKSTDFDCIKSSSRHLSTYPRRPCRWSDIKAADGSVQ